MKKEISIQELKIILLETMDVIDEFCRDNGIHYFLLAGSLLGAVRHKGFIPWDDDIDIGMFREDYDRFVSIFSSCKSNHVRLLCPENDAKYSYGFAKVVDTRTTVVENVDNSDELGVYVDVFPLDNCTSSLNFASNYVKGFFFLKCLNNFKVIKIDKKRSALKNFILAVGKVLTFFISRRMITNAIVKRSKRFQYEDSKFIAEMTGNVYGTKEIWEKEWFSELIDAQFEGRQYSIPKEYDKILTRTYGNYMELPPLYKRTSHHEFIAFWK